MTPATFTVIIAALTITELFVIHGYERIIRDKNARIRGLEAEIARLTGIAESPLSDADWAQSFVDEIRAELNTPVEYVPAGRRLRVVQGGV